jgi:hypothetical protein
MSTKSKTQQDLSNKVATTENINIRDIGFSSKDAVDLAEIIASGQVATIAAVSTAMRSAPATNPTGTDYTHLNGGAGNGAITLAQQADGTYAPAPAQKSLKELIVDNIGIVAAAAGVALVLYTHKR